MKFSGNLLDTETTTYATKGTYQPASATVLSANQSASASSNPQSMNPYAGMNMNQQYNSASMEAAYLGANAVGGGMNIDGQCYDGGDAVCDIAGVTNNPGGSFASGNVAAPSSGSDASSDATDANTQPTLEAQNTGFTGFGTGGGGAGGSWDPAPTPTDTNENDTAINDPNYGGSVTVSASAPNIEPEISSDNATLTLATGGGATGAAASSLASSSESIDFTGENVFWVGKDDGLIAAQQSGGNLLQLSPGAQAALDAGDPTLMIQESAQFAASTTGNPAVFIGSTGAGQTWVEAELPELLG